MLEKARKVIDYEKKKETKALKTSMTGGKNSLVGAGHNMMQGTAHSAMYKSGMSGAGGKNSGFGTYTQEDLQLVADEEEAR